MLSRDDIGESGEHRDILEAYRMFAHDRGWVRRMHEAIRNGLTAEAAVEKVQSDTRARLQRQTDPFLRDRLHDFDDLANRLLRVLMNKPHGLSGEDLPRDAIIVARNMGAAELLDYDRERVRGLVLEEGGPTSHVTIVARALGIASVGRAGDIVSLVENGDAIIVDGIAGEVHIRPPADVELAYAEKVRFRARRQEQYRLLRDQPAVTRDGHRVNLLMNAGLLVDLPHLTESGAEGIGLFRTELQFMIAARMPKLSEQKTLYAAVLDAAGSRPVTFRTLDIGGDKVLPYMRDGAGGEPGDGLAGDPPRPRPAGPAPHADPRPPPGRRRPRAPRHAADGHRPRRDQADAGADRPRPRPSPPPSAMPKPGAAPDRRDGRGAGAPLQLDGLVKAVDFISVGSNDLLQFMTATDRGNMRVAEPLRPAVAAVPARAPADRQGGGGGEAAGDALRRDGGQPACRDGADRASATARCRCRRRRIGPVKAMTHALHAGKLAEKLDVILDDSNAADGIRAMLTDFAEAEAIPL